MIEDQNAMVAAALAIAAESLMRIDELPEFGGCEVSAERAWHDGRLSTLKTLGLVDIHVTEAAGG